MDINSLFSTFNITSQITTINSEICEVSNSNFYSKVTICHKALTFGGRDNIPDELRVQIMYENNNTAFREYELTGNAALLGIHDSEDIVCAWKLKFSNATQGTISKQIKRKYIDEAIKVGFVQAPPNRSGEYVCVFRKEFIYFYLKNSSWLHDAPVKNLNEHYVPEIEEDIVVDASINESNRIKNGANVLLYGVPGSGKSWTIEHEYCRKDTNVERLVFHPDYTYSDFIGQILPNVAEDGQVSYKFTPGPFTNILADAYTHPQEEYILIIEEINRGNAPAIFGEVFQLLDRKTEERDVDDDGYPVGTSEYGITNANIAAIVYGDAKHKVRIPSNLSIIGTMNTSDQNVFTLDTAFQRRWEMRLIENNFEHVDKRLADAEILDTGITWEVFCTQINKIIVGNNARMTSAEDKRLGAYFVHLRDLAYNPDMGNLSDGEYDALRTKEENTTITNAERDRLAEIRAAMKQNRKFPEKVIKYLWDDAFKFNREIVFETTTYQSLEQVIRTFMYAEKLDRLAMFKDNVINAFTNPEE